MVISDKNQHGDLRKIKNKYSTCIPLLKRMWRHKNGIKVNYAYFSWQFLSPLWWPPAVHHQTQQVILQFVQSSLLLGLLWMVGYVVKSEGSRSWANISLLSHQEENFIFTNWRTMDKYRSTINSLTMVSRCLCHPLNWTNRGIEIQVFCYIINSQIMENKNCLLTWSIPIIFPYDNIFSKNCGKNDS